MAAITTASPGGFWDVGATWTGGVVPGIGDTVTLNHPVTIRTNVTVGDSPVTTGNVLSLSAAGANLTVQTGCTLTCRGDLHFTGIASVTAIFRMEPGSHLRFDSSNAAAPATTYYGLTQSLYGRIEIMGSSSQRCSISSIPGGGYGLINATPPGNNCEINFCDFSRMGVSGVDSGRLMNFAAGSGKYLIVRDCTFTDIGVGVYLGANADGDYYFERNRIYNVGHSNIIFSAAPLAATTGIRHINNNWFQGIVSIIGTGAAMIGGEMNGNFFQKITAGSAAVTPPRVTGANNTFVEYFAESGAIGPGGINCEFTDSFVLFNNSQSGHQEGIFLFGGNCDLFGGVVENTYNLPGATILASPATFDKTHTAATQVQTIKNWIYALSASDKAPCKPFQLKGTKWLRYYFENNTYPMAQDTDPAHGVTGHGNQARNWPGVLSSCKNNLFWTPPGYTSPAAGRSYLVEDQPQGTISGTALGTSTTTTLNITPSSFGTGSASQEGMTLKITSGPDSGLTRTVAVGNTATSLTVTSAFPNTMAGQTFTLYGVDALQDAHHNAISNAVAEGTLYDASRNSARTGVKGYNAYALSSPNDIGVGDIYPASVSFVDTSRTIARWSIDVLGNPVRTPWAAGGTAYAVGDLVSYAVAGFYGGRTINFRCIQAHSSGAVGSLTEPGTYLGTNVANGHWRYYWELEGLWEMRRCQTFEPGYNPAATQASYLEWIRAGYVPTTEALRGAASDGGDIGAVALAAAASGGGRRRFLRRLLF